MHKSSWFILNVHDSSGSLLISSVKISTSSPSLEIYLSVFRVKTTFWGILKDVVLHSRTDPPSCPASLSFDTRLLTRFRRSPSSSVWQQASLYRRRSSLARDLKLFAWGLSRLLLCEDFDVLAEVCGLEQLRLLRDGVLGDLFCDDWWGVCGDLSELLGDRVDVRGDLSLLLGDLERCLLSGDLVDWDLASGVYIGVFPCFLTGIGSACVASCLSISPFLPHR